MHPHFEIVKSPLVIRKDKKIILRNCLRGDSYSYSKTQEHNKYLGKQGWQVKFYDRRGFVLKRFCFENENDVIEFFIEINAPSFNSWVYDIDPLDVDKVLLFTTQALTANPGVIQNFSIPSVWGPNNTISAIGGGGNGTIGQRVGGLNIPGFAGSGAAFASISNRGYDRNSTVPYFIGSGAVATSSPSTGNNAQATSFNTSQLIAAGATKNGGNGLAANSTGDIKFDGGLSGSLVSSAGSAVSGPGGGSAAGPSGTPVAVGGTAVVGGNSGVGANSATASGGASSAGVGNPGGNGTDFDASHGAGAAGSGGGNGANQGGNAGNYGAGCGGPGVTAAGASVAVTLAGSQGMLFLSYNPYIYSEFYTTP